MTYTADILKVGGNTVDAVTYTAAGIATSAVDTLIVHKENDYEWHAKSNKKLGLLFGTDRNNTLFPQQTNKNFVADGPMAAVYRLTDSQLATSTVSGSAANARCTQISIDYFGFVFFSTFASITDHATGMSSKTVTYTLTGEDGTTDTVTWENPATNSNDNRFTTMDGFKTKFIKLPSTRTVSINNGITDLNYFDDTMVLPTFVAILKQGSNGQFIQDWGTDVTNFFWKIYEDGNNAYSENLTNINLSRYLVNQKGFENAYISSRVHGQSIEDEREGSSSQRSLRLNNVTYDGRQLFFSMNNNGIYKSTIIVGYAGNNRVAIYFLQEPSSESRIYRYIPSKFASFNSIKNYDICEYNISKQYEANDSNNYSPITAWPRNRLDGNYVFEDVQQLADAFNNPDFPYKQSTNYLFQLGDVEELAGRMKNKNTYSITTQSGEKLCIPEEMRFTDNNQQYVITHNIPESTTYQTVYWGLQQYRVYTLFNTTVTFTKLTVGN